MRYGTADEAGMLKERLDIAKSLTRKWVDQEILNSAVILAARRGVIVLHEAFGKINYKPDSPPAELDTLCSMACIVKPVIATALMCLVEDGLVGLANPIVDYIPEFIGEGKDKVLVRQLLTNTSGIIWTNKFGDILSTKIEKGEIPTCEPTQDPTTNLILLLTYGIPLSYPPGKEMRYSDVNFYLAGEIVRRVSGKSFDSFIRERIFDKLGMKDSYYYRMPEHVINRVARRSPKLRFQKENEDDYIPLWTTTTTMDMAIFTQMFLNKGLYGDKRITSPPSVYEMTHNQIPGVPAKYGDEFFPEANWCYGWAMARQWFDEGSMHSPKAFGHGGYGTVYLWGDPEYDLVGAFFTTSNKTEKRYMEHGSFVNVVMSAIDD